MRKTALLYILCLASLTAMAQNGWQYDNEGRVLIVSEPRYLSGYGGEATYYGIMVGKAQGENRVLIGLYGDKTTHDIRKNQQYIVASFDLGKSTKWRVRQYEANGSKLQYLLIEDADQFIANLRKAEHFSVTVPIFGVGNTSFSFYTGGYPLDY